MSDASDGFPPQRGVDESRRQRTVRRIRLGLALLVGVSMGLVALNANADPAFGVGALLVGTAVGGVAAWWLVPDDLGRPPSGGHRQSRR